MRPAVLALLALVALAALGVEKSNAAEKRRKSATREAATRDALEKRFEEDMSGVTLLGNYTVAEEKNPQLKTERYDIAKVTKIEGDTWQFDVAIRYGDHDVKAPLRLQVLWAGDTPVITVKDVTVPLLGTFNARVLIQGGQYAGTWSAGANHGGQLFGQVVKTSDLKNGEAPKADAKEKP